jgi:D-aminopeptidase
MKKPSPSPLLPTCGSSRSVKANEMRRNQKTLTNDAMSPLFLAVIEATEEAIYNSLFRATSTTTRGHRVEALPLDRTVEILRRHGLISPVR